MAKKEKKNETQTTKKNSVLGSIFGGKKKDVAIDDEPSDASMFDNTVHEEIDEPQPRKKKAKRKSFGDILAENREKKKQKHAKRQASGG